MRFFVLILVFLISPMVFSQDIDYRQEMRNFVMELRSYADSQTGEFFIIPQNGQELITFSGDPDGILQEDYLSAIDGSGREDLFFGYENDDEQTALSDRQYLFDLCRLYEKEGVEVIVTDYCSTPANVDYSYLRNAESGFVSFAAGRRELDVLPSYPEVPYNVNNKDIIALKDVRNFLYLINGEAFDSKADFIKAVARTDYDLLIIDLFYDGSSWSSDEINRLKRKAGGGSRLVICYMSIGEAEDYRFYWEAIWQQGKPGWFAGENPYWEGNFKVRYWDEGWKKIIYGNDESYLKRIIDAGFDGVYLDIVDAFEYFE